MHSDFKKVVSFLVFFHDFSEIFNLLKKKTRLNYLISTARVIVIDLVAA